MEKIARKRLDNFCIFGLLLLTEVMIALFVDDRFLRPYGGDIIVVIVIYFFVRIFVPDKLRLLPLWVFLFALFVEMMQYISLVDRLGLSHSRFFSTVMGTSFSVADIGCYAMGCVALGIYEAVKYKKQKKASEKETRIIVSEE